jgi:hypothetical protein
MNDSTSAETYCTLGGDIVPPKVAQSIADDCGLQDWVSTLFGLHPIKGVNGKGVAGPTPVTRLKTVNEALKKELLKVLLEVYMDIQYATFCLLSPIYVNYFYTTQTIGSCFSPTKRSSDKSRCPRCT